MAGVDIAGCCREVLAGLDEDLLEYIAGSVGEDEVPSQRNTQSAALPAPPHALEGLVGWRCMFFIIYYYSISRLCA
jgi:hypothetical protein